MKMKTGFLIAIISVFLVSCYTPRYMYSPSSQNVPVLVKQGDSKLAASYSTDLSNPPLAGNTSGTEDKNNGFDLQGAVAVTNNFAIQVNYFNRTERNNGGNGYADSAVINYKRNLTEVGIGYFKSLNAKDRVLFQVFGGIGKGRFSLTEHGRRSDSVYTAFTKTHQSDVTKFYVQPAIIFRPRNNFSISISTRLSIMEYRNIKTNYDIGELQDYKLTDLGRGYFTFWEPAFTNTFGFKKLPGIRFEYQFGITTLISDRFIDYRAFNFSLGMAFDLPKLFRADAGNNKN